MKNLSLKLKEDIYNETEKVVKKLKVPRNSYFNKAIDFYNKLISRKIIKAKLENDSLLVSAESMNVLKEFEEIEYHG